MDFREIEYMRAIAKHQNITNAASELKISQPSLSRFLMRLEKTMETKLFSKLGKKMVPTHAGECYLESARDILDIHGQLKQKIKDISRMKDGKIAIGTTPTRGQYVLPDILPAFAKLYPQYHIEIYEKDVDTLEDMLATGAIQLAFFTTTKKSFPLFTLEKIAGEEIVLCISPEHPLANLAMRREGFKYPWYDLRNLENETFLVLDERMRLGQYAAKIFKDLGMAPYKLVFSNVETAMLLASENFGVCLCSEIGVRHCHYKREPLFYSIGQGDAAWDFVVAWRKNSYFSQAMADMLAITRSLYGE